MNPFQRLGVKISNWWRGEPQNDGGKTTGQRRRCDTELTVVP